MRRRQFLPLLGCAAAAWPLGVHAQGQRRIPRIGVLWHAGNAEEEHPYYESLIEGFKNAGYGEGRIVLDHRFPNEIPDLFRRMAAELVSLKPDVLVAVGAASVYAKAATTAIPVVFVYVPDPVGANLVQSVRRPGGNATGLSNFSVELSEKRLEYLKRIVPTLSRVALLVNPNVKISNLYIEQSKAAESKLGLTTQAFDVGNLNELEAAFDAMVNAGMQAVVVNAESLFYQAKDAIAKLALVRRLPTCVWVSELVDAGALVSYGVDQRAIARRVALYVDRILKGEKPAEMPVEQPTRFQLHINARTAKALGIHVPAAILTFADRVIE